MTIPLLQFQLNRKLNFLISLFINKVKKMNFIKFFNPEFNYNNSSRLYLRSKIIYYNSNLYFDLLTIFLMNELTRINIEIIIVKQFNKFFNDCK